MLTSTLLAPLASAADEVLPSTPRGPHTELTPAPVIGGSSDVGFGGGGILSLALLAPGYEPYVYRVEAAFMATFAETEDGGVMTPYQDHYLLLDLPHLRGGDFGLTLRVSYSREATLKYYGIGNAASIPPERDPGDSYFEYDRIHPKLLIDTETRLSNTFSITAGVSYSHNFIRFREDGKLAEDQRSADPFLADRTRLEPTHVVVTFGAGVLFDTRDDKVSPRRGQLVSARVDWSPGGAGAAPYHWGRFDGSAAMYVPLPARSALAFRVVGDVLFGDPPVYELAQFDSSSALGGPRGVRGVPGQRYHGMVKLFGNAELRVPIVDFHFLKKDNTLGVVGFFDAGRLWAAHEPRPDLDGSDVGLKLGAGGGLRVRAGKTFVLRGDVAWSPDASPVSGYLGAGHAF